MDDLETIPAHIALIADGNRRWARKNGLSAHQGHEAGFNQLNEIIREAARIGVRHFTVYAFSTENWSRSEVEVADLMSLFERVLCEYVDECVENGVRVIIAGDKSRFSKSLQGVIDRLESATFRCEKMILNLCMNYGGRAEILNACRILAGRVKSGEMMESDITEDVMHAALYTADSPDPDLVIRTSGEQRISGFLLWQIAYSEFMFEPKYLPEYTVQDFHNSIREYGNRSRRFGG